LIEALAAMAMNPFGKRYCIIVSEEVQQHEANNQGRVVALDPGVRTFMTFFSESS